MKTGRLEYNEDNEVVFVEDPDGPWQINRPGMPLYFEIDVTKIDGSIDEEMEKQKKYSALCKKQNAE